MPRLHNRAGLAACSLFLLLAILVIPYAGIQADGAFLPPPFFPTLTITYAFHSGLTTFP